MSEIKGANEINEINEIGKMDKIKNINKVLNSKYNEYNVNISLLMELKNNLAILESKCMKELRIFHKNFKLNKNADDSEYINCRDEYNEKLEEAFFQQEKCLKLLQNINIDKINLRVEESSNYLKNAVNGC